MTGTTKVNLTEQVQGALPVANGGTAAVSLTGLVKGNGTSAMTAVTAPSGAVVGTSDTQTLTNKTLTNPTITDYDESVWAIGGVTTTQALILTNGTLMTATLTSGTLCTFTMPTAAVGLSFTLALTQPASGSLGSAAFTGVKWPGGVTPTITPTLAKTDLLTFVCVDGTNWLGSYAQNY